MTLFLITHLAKPHCSKVVCPPHRASCMSKEPKLGVLKTSLNPRSLGLTSFQVCYVVDGSFIQNKQYKKSFYKGINKLFS